jgi:ankyrin repeat protein
MRRNCTYSEFLRNIKSNNMANIQHFMVPSAYYNQADDQGYYPLHHSARFNYYELTEYLLNKSANPNVRNIKTGESPLSLASYNGNSKIVTLLLNNSADLKLGGFYFGTPLCDAARKGRYEIVKILCDHAKNRDIGGLVDGHDQYKFRPLHLAVYNDDKESYPAVISLLLSYGASNECRAYENMTPEELALKHGRHSIADIVSRRKIYTPPSSINPPHFISTATLPYNKDLENQIAIAAALMSAGTYMFILSITMMMVNNKNALKLAAFSICAVTLGSYIAGQESGKIIKSTGHRFHEFFRHIEGNAERVTTAIVNASDALISSTETVNAAINRLSKTVDESIIVLKDESKNTMIELRGIGRDIAAALKQGINEGKFTPQAHVNANVFAAVPICNLM